MAVCALAKKLPERLEATLHWYRLFKEMDLTVVGSDLAVQMTPWIEHRYKGACMAQ